jgi:hypothetical protein
VREQLAHIETIKDIKNIEGKDLIGLATILGWEVIVKKSEFKVGDECVFFEIDSVLPDSDTRFEFMKKTNYRVKTMKMGGVVSQGLALPLSMFPEITKDSKDVTEILKVKHYEAIEQSNVINTPKPWYQRCLKKYSYRLYKLLYKSFDNTYPPEIPKTDETRIQAIPELWDKMRNYGKLYVTEKIDGQSATYLLRRGKHWWSKPEFVIASRNIAINPKDSTNWTYIAKKYGIKEKLRKNLGCSDWVAIQGEIVGQGIQGNKYKLKDRELYIFNVYNDLGRFTHLGMKKFIGYFGIKPVPEVPLNYSKDSNITELVEMSKGNSLLNPDTIREGIVIRNIIQRESFKVINPDFLLKYDL